MERRIGQRRVGERVVVAGSDVLGVDEHAEYEGPKEESRRPKKAACRCSIRSRQARPAASRCLPSFVSTSPCELRGMGAVTILSSRLH